MSFHYHIGANLIMVSDDSIGRMNKSIYIGRLFIRLYIFLLIIYLCLNCFESFVISAAFPTHISGVSAVFPTYFRGIFAAFPTLAVANNARGEHRLQVFASFNNCMIMSINSSLLRRISEEHRQCSSCRLH